ncbi:Tc toxin subunit A [Pandoraea sputorum]|uniref:Big-1 domain-containing protein n=1 Tax=Pandoraea sputorum TaxID=93222 RepID=A0A5E5AVH5_9BURK|nr:Tc toxin subunit A [Pandoraea sputorum]VVE77444.1 hypothetical protein PSP31121_01044 [Pandoraea sputorum]
MARKSRSNLSRRLLADRLASSPPTRLATQQAGNVVALARTSVWHLLEKTPGLHIDEARALHGRAASAGIVVARRFRERELVRSTGLMPDFTHGMQALANTPEYGNLFEEDWAAMAKPNAIEARTSPVAYLLTLFRRALTLESTGTRSDFKLKLAERRPDIAEEVIDEQAMSREIASLDVSTNVLEYAISAYLRALASASEDTPDIDLAMSEVRYPMSMPYEHWITQIGEVLSLASGEPLSLGEVSRQVDPGYHYFVTQGMQTPWGDDAMLLSLPLGPMRRELLLAPLYTGDIDSAAPSGFYRETYGADGLPELFDTAVFCARTHTPSTSLPALFAVQTSAPVASENVAGLPAATGSSFGAVYINGGREPAIAIEAGAPIPSGSGAFAEPVAVHPPHYFTELDDERADRTHRLIRLSRWLELSYADTDRLLVAAHVAQYLPGAPVITTSSLRALGVFREMQTRYGVKAEDFAAWLTTLAPYGHGEDSRSQFDRVFNASRQDPIPLVLDGSAFGLQRNFSDAASLATIQQISVALGLSPEAFDYLARVISASHGEGPLTRTLDVVSAFFRIASLARYLQISPIVLLGLMEMLGQEGDPIVAQMAGVPSVHSLPGVGQTDFLSTLVAVEGCVRWCREKGIDVAWLVQHLRPASTPQIADDAERLLISDLHRQLTTTRITLARFYEAGVPPVIDLPLDETGKRAPTTPDWLCHLREIIDRDGIVLDGVASTDADLETSVAGIVSAAVASLFSGAPNICQDVRHASATAGITADAALLEAVPTDEQQAYISETLTAVILQTHAAQRAIVEEAIAGYLGIASELVLPLIDWAQQSPYEILRWAWDAGLESRADFVRAQIASRLNWPPARAGLAADEPFTPSEVMLHRLGDLRRQSEVVAQFALDGEMLTQHARNERRLAIGERDAFGFAPGANHLRDLYYLQTYRDIIDRGLRSPGELLDYLALINTPNVIDEDALEASDGYARLIRDAAAGKVAALLGASARDVLDAALIVSPLGIVRKISEFSGILRVLSLSGRTGLSIVALDHLGQLAESGSTPEYRRAVQDAFSCLSANTEAPTEAQRAVVPEVGQGATSSCTVSRDLLIARADDVENNQADFKLTIRDLAGEPLSGVPVRWSVSGAGVIDAETSTTDTDGVAEVTLFPGSTMGTAHVFGTIGLDQRLALPAVRVDCQETSLKPYDSQPNQPTPVLAGERQTIELSVRLLDDYRNDGISREIRWSIVSGPGRLLRSASLTDRNGVARVVLVSRNVGTTMVQALYGELDSTIGPIQFVDAPYIDSDYGIRALSPNLAGQPFRLMCVVLSLSGDPRPDIDVEWTVNDKSMGKTKSDRDGIAILDVEPDGVGILEVVGAVDGRSVMATFEIVDDPMLIPLDQSAMRYLQDPHRFGFVSVRADASDYPETGHDGPPPVVRLPVEWEIDGTPARTVATDLAGQSRLPIPLAKAGGLVVTASAPGTNTVEFDVTVVPLPEWIVTLDGAPVTGTLEFVVGQAHVLQVKPATGHASLVGMEVLLTWDGTNPTGQGLQARPPYQQIRVMVADGLKWTLTCEREPSASALFSLGIRLVDPRHVHWLRVRTVFPNSMRRVAPSISPGRKA